MLWALTVIGERWGQRSDCRAILRPPRLETGPPFARTTCYFRLTNKDIEAMLRFCSRPSPNTARVAVFTIVSLLGSPLAPLVAAQAPRPAGRCGRAGCSGWRVAACLHDSKRRHARDLPAASLELGQSEAGGSLRGRVVHGEGRDNAGARHRQGGIGHERRPGRAARELLGLQDRRAQVPHAPARSAPDRRRGARPRRCRSRSASSRSTGCWPTSTTARSCRRTWRG